MAVAPSQPLPTAPRAQPVAPLNNPANESCCQHVWSSQPARGRTPARGTREEKPVSLTLLHHRFPGCAVGEFGAAARGSAARQGHSEEEEERGRGPITGGSRCWGTCQAGGRDPTRSMPRPVSRCGLSPACGALLHPSSANKASAKPVPPLALTHGLT